MRHNDPNEINLLIGEFMDLQERWEREAAVFEWPSLQDLSRKGALAYNEGAGPSFHALALDGVPHSEFHERFLGYSLEAGFDPFKLVVAGSGTKEIPVIDHSSLAEDARLNPFSARMRFSLMELARTRFEPFAQAVAKGGLQSSDAELFHVVEACAESIPLDLLERIAPELAESHRAIERRESVDPVEGYLSVAEVIVDNHSQVYG